MSDNHTPLILVVDDEERNLRLMKAILTAWNYEVRLARDGHEALQMVKETSPDVVLLDVMLPDIEGFDVVALMREDAELREIPVVMVTALTTKEHRVRALEAGADDFLTKPVDRSELQARVKSLVQVRAYRRHIENYKKQLEVAVELKTRELQRAIENLRLSYLDTIHRLSRAAEYRDQETHQHIVRMGYYAAVIARQMGMSGSDVETMLCAAPMHDVGKIGIPDGILLKRGRLTKEEFETMAQHTLIGARILENPLDELTEWARVIALTHHEKWDGTGYPDKLKGEGIPLSGRIVAVADVFDALTSKRPYKEAFPLDKSLRIMEEGRGTHFDPLVLDAFFAALDDILHIKARHADDGRGSLLEHMAGLSKGVAPDDAYKESSEGDSLAGASEVKPPQDPSKGNPSQD